MFKLGKERMFEFEKESMLELAKKGIIELEEEVISKLKEEVKLKPKKENKKYDSYSVVFNDLTVREDSGTIDQAVDTIEKLVSNNKLEALSKLGHQAYDYSKNVYAKAEKFIYGRNHEDEKRHFAKLKDIKEDEHNFMSSVFASDYNGVSISIKNPINSNKLKSILSPDIEIEDLTKEAALQQIDGEVGFLCKHIFPECWSSDYSDISLKVRNVKGKVVSEKVWAYEKESSERGTTKKVCDFIKEKAGDDLRYDLVLKNSNKSKSKAFYKALGSTIFNIEFLALSTDKAIEKAKTLRHESLSITLSGDQNSLGTLLSKAPNRLKGIEKVKLVEKDSASIFYRKYALEVLENRKQNKIEI